MIKHYFVRRYVEGYTDEFPPRAARVAVDSNAMKLAAANALAQRWANKYETPCWVFGKIENGETRELQKVEPV